MLLQLYEIVPDLMSRSEPHVRLSFPHSQCHGTEFLCEQPVVCLMLTLLCSASLSRHIFQSLSIVTGLFSCRYMFPKRDDYSGQLPNT